MVGLIIWEHFFLEHVNEVISIVILFVIKPHGPENMIAIDNSRF